MNGPRFPARRSATARTVCLVSSLVLGGCPADGASAPRERPAAAASQTECVEVSVHCGAAPTLAFDDQGRLWAAFAQDGRVHVSRSADLGRTFTRPVPVHAGAEAVETNGENRPKIAFGRDAPEVVYVSWTRKVEGKFNGEIRFSRSLDGGATFEPPRTVNDDGRLTGHRFDSLHVDPAGDVYLTWIDKRDRDAARARGDAYRGAALYYAVSGDRGASFTANRRVADFACECCRIAVADAPGAGVAVLWRHIFAPNVRDHAFAVLGRDGVSSPLERATRDGWEIDACPHHGPAMAADGDGGFHLTWFTAAGRRPRVHYGHFDPATGELRRQLTIAAGDVQAHPHLLASGDRLRLVWKGLGSGEATHVYLRESRDGGLAWSDRRSLASTAGASDHPFLVAHRDRALLAWHTAAEGLRMLPLSH